MARRFSASDSTFAEAFSVFLDEPRGGESDVTEAVSAIVADVRARGFAAVAELTAKFDQWTPDEVSVQIDADRVEAALRACDPRDVEALEFAAARIRAYHVRQKPSDHSFVDDAGVQLGWRWTPLDAVGLYVPGGRAAYPSSLLMNAIPAKVAGVGRLAITVPTPQGELNPLVLAAAHVAGADEIYAVGGAQAVAALAYGAGPIHPVDKIVGPGNAFVAAAKRLVFGDVGIDTIAGPSEILVIADAQNDPAWTAADLLSQCEHDPSSQAILITDDAAFAEAVEAAVDTALGQLATSDTARASWRDHGAVVMVDDLMIDASGVANQIAAEHVEIACDEAAALAENIRHAGAIFLGRRTPEALGDYVTGSNHVLPTARAARFSSGLSTLDFMKRTSIQHVTEDGLAAIGPAAARLARAEGLPAHALSVDVRLNGGHDG